MEQYFVQRIKQIGLWGLVVLVVLVVMIIQALQPKNNGDALNVFEHVYCSGETLKGPSDGGTVTVRLEKDKILLLRGGDGVWKNLGVLVQGESEQDAVEVWKTSDGNYRILVMRDGVCLADRERTVWLNRVDTLSVGVETERGNQFLNPQWYLEGETVNPDYLVQCSISGKATLVLNLEEYQDELVLKQDGEEMTLARDRSRTFLLEVEGTPGQRQVFEVPFASGTYRFALVFE